MLVVPLWTISSAATWVYYTMHPGELTDEEERIGKLLVDMVDADPDEWEEAPKMSQQMLLDTRKGKRRPLKTPFLQDVVNETRAKLGFLRDTPDNRRVVETTMLRLYKEKNVRAFDVSRHLPLARSMYFIPTESQIEEVKLNTCKAMYDKQVAMHTDRYSWLCPWFKRVPTGRTEER